MAGWMGWVECARAERRKRGWDVEWDINFNGWIWIGGIDSIARYFVFLRVFIFFQVLSVAMVGGGWGGKSWSVWALEGCKGLY